MTDIKNLLEIVIMTYNRKNHLQKTLEQLLDEKSPIKDFEIKILDNCSTDGTSEMIKDYSQRYHNIIHVRHNKNIGGNANAAMAFQAASKKYIWVLCDNDTYNWDSWTEIEKALQKDYDVIFVQKGKKDISIIYLYGTFLPACIYKTENITSTVLFNIFDNIRNMFPHLPILAKNINDNNDFYFPNKDLITVGINQEHHKSYIRGFDEKDIPESKRKMYWMVGYMNSIELISDRKKQIEIIDKLRYFHRSLFDLFKTKIFKNLVLYDNSFHNYYEMFRLLSFFQKIKFLIAAAIINFKYAFANKKYIKLVGNEKWIAYFEDRKEDKKLKKLANKLKNKKVLIYGAGIISNILFDKYDMSQFNIVGVADQQFSKNDFENFKGYKAIAPNEIKNQDFDVIIFAIMNHCGIEKKLRKQLKNRKRTKMISVIERNSHVVL